MKPQIFTLIFTSILFGYSPTNAQDAVLDLPASSTTYSSIYWSDADSGRLGSIKFRIANKDGPETGSLKQRGGAKCEYERKLGYKAKAFMVGFTNNKSMRIARDYGEDRYGRLVVDLEADGSDVAEAGVAAGHLKDWLHIKGRAQYAKPDWCAGAPD